MNGFPGSRIRRQAGPKDSGIHIDDDNLKFTLGFKLDGVQDYTDLEVRKRPFLCTIFDIRTMCSDFG